MYGKDFEDGQSIFNRKLPSGNAMFTKICFKSDFLNI